MPATPATKKSSKTVLIVGGIVAAILLTYAPALLFLIGVALVAISLVALIKGSVPRLLITSRKAGAIALGTALVLMIVSGTALSGAAAPEDSALPSTSPHSSTPAPSATATASTAAATTYEEIEEIVVIPFGHTTIDDPESDRGTSQVRTAGADGTKTLVYRVTLVDGTEVSRVLLRESITNAPVDEVTAIGTREPVADEPVAFFAPDPTVDDPAQEEPPAEEPAGEGAPSGDCHPSYADVCVPITTDVDCAGGSGDGPAYVEGPLRVVGDDEYDLDRDGDGIACDA